MTSPSRVSVVMLIELLVVASLPWYQDVVEGVLLLGSVAVCLGYEVAVA